jgi:hypothetical protein
MQRTAYWASVVTAALVLARGAAEGAMGGEAPEAAPPKSASFTGTVVETMDARRYTYVCVDTGKDKIWAAAPAVAVKKGDTVTIAGGMRMTDFESKALNRTFPEVYFVEKITVAGAVASTAGAIGHGTATKLPPGHPSLDLPAAATPTNLPPGHPPIGQPAACAPTNLPPGHPVVGQQANLTAKSMDFSNIRKPDGGKTVAEVWEGRAKLAGQTILLRGKVAKIVTDVMGRNWLHLRDGTGAEGRNDLTVTTKATAAVGDTVTVKGVLATNRDFGAGYSYEAIVEDATVTP